MDRQSAQTGDNCLRKEIVAYIDGELSVREEAEFEAHLRLCPGCAEELNKQKKLVCALDIALDKNCAIDVPENFTRTVVANAESKVSGLRRPQERFRALFVCSALVLLLMIGLGEERNAVFAAFGTVSEKMLAVGGFGFHIVHDFAVGIAVVLRSLCHRFIFNTAVSAALLFAVFVIAAVAVSRFLNRQDRA